MFTGIIESRGVINSVIHHGTGKTFWLTSPIAPEFRADQSISHDGACLTVEEVQNNTYRVTVIGETLSKTNLGDRISGDSLNLERSLLMNGRLDGHLVQGHVDTTATCIERKEASGSWIYRFEIPSRFASLIIEKGSICINGISLTIFDVKKKSFRVAIIPFTYSNTNIQMVQKGSTVNIEFDMIGKYIQRITALDTKKTRL